MESSAEMVADGTCVCGHDLFAHVPTASGLHQSCKENTMTDYTYRVSGTAHGDDFSESFATSTEAQNYASSIIDGDYDSTVSIKKEES